MKRTFKVFGFIAFTFLLFFAVAATAFYHLVSVGEFRRFLINQIEHNTDLKVELGEGDLQMGRILGIAFRNVTISEAAGAEPDLTAERITARVALWPLIHRRVVFYQIHLERPAARMTRDKDGKILFLEKLLHLPLTRASDFRFSLDLRQITVSGGTVRFQDSSGEGLSAPTDFREIDLNLQRVRGQAVREFFQKLLRGKQSLPSGTALEFDCKTRIWREEHSAYVRAHGSMAFPEGQQFAIENAWWDAKAQITEIPATLVPSLTVIPVRLESVAGSLNSSFSVQGSAKDRLRIQGDVASKKLVIGASELFAAPLESTDTRINFDTAWEAEHWHLARLDVESNLGGIALRGTVRGRPRGDPYMEISLKSPLLPIATLKKLFPVNWLKANDFNRYLNTIEQGDVQLTKASLSGTVTEIRAMMANGFDDRLSATAEVRNLGLNPTGGYLPLRGVHGHVELERGLVSFTNFRGSYGRSRLSKVDGTYRLSGSAAGALRIQAQGDIDLAELREEARQGRMEAAIATAAGSVQDFGGRAKVNLSIAKSPGTTPTVDGNLTLDGARLQFDDLTFSELRGDVAFNPNEIKAEKVLGAVFGSPIEIHLSLKDYTADNGMFDLGIDSRGIKAGILTRLLLNSGSLQDPGIVRGSMRYQGPLTRKDGRRFSASLELANVQLATKPLLQPLRDLNGKIRIDPAGIDFQNITGVLVGFPATLNGRWRYGQRPQLLFDFAAPNLDITYLLTQIDPEATEFYANLLAEGRIALDHGQLRSFEFSNFKSAVSIDHRVWRFTDAVMRADGGSIQSVATLSDKPELLSFSVTPKIQSVPIQSVLRWFEISNREMTGNVAITGHLESSGNNAVERKKNLNGTFSLRIEDGTIQRLRVVVQILNFLDLSRWFSFQLPDLAKDGIRFRRISGDFKVVNGVYSTENLLVDSNDLKMSGAGKLDIPNDQIDFIVAVRPFAGIDTAFNYIPLLGRGIAAIKNSFLVASFHVIGSIDEPTIVPAPLSTLSEWFFGVLGIPKNMIGLGDNSEESVPKEKPQEKSSSPAVNP
jgi:uncharacterized protein YhdP